VIYFVSGKLQAKSRAEQNIARNNAATFPENYLLGSQIQSLSWRGRLITAGHITKVATRLLVFCHTGVCVIDVPLRCVQTAGMKRNVVIQNGNRFDECIAAVTLLGRSLRW
jgi:hypothetical protein